MALGTRMRRSAQSLTVLRFTYWRIGFWSNWSKRISFVSQIWTHVDNDADLWINFYVGLSLFNIQHDPFIGIVRCKRNPSLFKYSCFIFFFFRSSPGTSRSIRKELKTGPLRSVRYGVTLLYSCWMGTGDYTQHNLQIAVWLELQDCS